MLPNYYGTYLRAGLGDGTKVVDHVSLGHTYTGIANSEELVLLIRDDANIKLLLGLEGRWIRKGSITYFIKGVRSVGD